MASTLSLLERQRLLDAFGTQYGFASAHSGDPGSRASIPWDAFPDPEHHEGSGVISLHARLAGAGFKSFESDDELVLALAA